MERLRDLDRGLARHDVHNLPARGVYDDEVVATVPGGPDAALSDLLRRQLGALVVHRYPELASDLLELVNGRRAVGITGDEVRILAEFAHEEGELSCDGRLAVAVQPREHDHGRWPGGERELVGGTAHQGRQLLVDDLDNLLAGTERL